MVDLSRRSFVLAGSSAIAALALTTDSPAQEQAPKLKFEVTRSGAGFRWRLKAANGKVIATSGEAYKNKADCLHAIDLIKRGAGTATTEDKTQG